MEGKFDVIIVGAGPAGAAAAHHLAKAGARVLLLAGRPGRAKPCGGCISLRSARLLAEFDPPPWFQQHHVDTLWLVAPGRAPLCQHSHRPGALFVDRQLLDAFLLDRAREAGARVVRRRARAVGRADGLFVVESDSGSFRADWLLGADGASSLVGRTLGLAREGWLYAALVEERPLTGRLARLLDGAALLELGGVAGGYGWAFGRGNTLNLGMAYRHDAGPKGSRYLVSRYKRFLARLGLGEPGPWRGAAIPCAGARRLCLVRGRAAVIGDAARVAEPFLGEGVGQAVFSGLAAARAILAHDLARYQQAMSDSLHWEHSHARLVARLVFSAPGVFQSLARNHPGAVEVAWEILRGGLVYPEIWRGLAQVYAGRPLTLDRLQRGVYSKYLN